MKRNFYEQITALLMLSIFVASCSATKSTTETSVAKAAITSQEPVFIPNLKKAQKGALVKDKNKDSFKAKFGLVGIVLRNDTLFVKCTHGGGCGKTKFFLNEQPSSKKEVVLEILARSNDKCRMRMTSQVYFLMNIHQGKNIKIKHREELVYEQRMK